MNAWELGRGQNSLVHMARVRPVRATQGDPPPQSEIRQKRKYRKSSKKTQDRTRCPRMTADP